MMRGDESYAGSESFFRLKRVVDDLTGFRHMIPTHQGRAAERILFTVMCKPGHVVPSNTHFDTTRANIEFTGARAVDLPLPEAADTQARLDFKGNMDVAALEALIARGGRGANPAGHADGHQQLRRRPAGLDGEYRSGEARSARATASRSIWTPAASPKTPGSSASASPGTRDWTPKQIAQKMFSLADGCTFSAKKDAFANIGGLLCTNDDRVAQQETNLLILTEGFPTYGGLAGPRPGRHRRGPGRGARPRLSALPHRVHRLPGPAHRGPRRAHRGAARRARHLHRCGAHAAAHPARAVSGAGAGGRTLPARRESARWRSAR